jgi:hypothetical protein
MRKSTMTTLCIALAFVATISRVQAQSALFLGAKGGVSIPNLQAGGSNQVSNGYKSILGPYFGIFADKPLTRRFSIQVELNYSAQGGQKNGEQAIPSSTFSAYFPPGYTPPQYFYANFDSKARLNYLELPVLAKFTFPIGGHVKFLIDAGPYVGYLLTAKNITKDSSEIYMDQAETEPVPVGRQSFYDNQSLTSDIHRFNFGIQGGIGLQYMVHHCGYFYLQVGGNYGLVNIQKYAADGQNQTGAATAAIGYAIKLK